MKKEIIITTLLLLMMGTTFAQVGIGTTTPDPSSLLDLSSSSKGILTPRMTSAQRNAISNPADGLQIYNTDTKCLNIFKKVSWWELCGNCIPPASPVASNNGPICSGDTLKLSSSIINGVTYSWTGPNGYTSSQQNPVIINPDTTYSGIYYVTATQFNCNTVPVPTTAQVKAVPSSAFTFSPATPDTTTYVTFSPALNGATYNWTFQKGNPATSTIPNTVVKFDSIGVLNVSLQVSNNGCSSTTTDTVGVKSCLHGTQTFIYTGSQQTFTVQGCISSITVDVRAAQGGSYSSYTGGNGGQTLATLSVTPGSVLYIFVGNQPTNSSGGYNGGGNGVGSSGRGGGGASDIRTNPSDLNSRIVVSGAGGGDGAGSSGWNCYGGAGGNPNGNDGTGSNGANYCGKGATQSGGGSKDGSGSGGSSGTFGVGGDGDTNWGDYTSGGGGGYYGGGGGGAGGAGGGSSWTNGTGVTYNSGYQSGDGQVIITW